MTVEGEKDPSIINDFGYADAQEVSRLIQERLPEIKDLLWHGNNPERANPEYLRKVLSSINEINGLVSKAIDVRENALNNIETEEDIDSVNGNMMSLFYEIESAGVEISLGMYTIMEWFKSEKESDKDWKQAIRMANGDRYQSAETIQEALSLKPFKSTLDHSAQDKLKEMNSNDTERGQLPSQHLFLEAQLINSISHLHGILRSILFYNVTKHDIDPEKFLQPTKGIEDVHEFGELLLERTHLLISRPFDVPEDKSGELNDLLSELIFTQRAVLDMFEKLKIGSGPYEPDLSNPEHHMVTNKKEPRIPYANLPMWPIKRKRISRIGLEAVTMPNRLIVAKKAIELFTEILSILCKA